MDQVSPELALVDPELAAEARAALPEAASIKRPSSVERPAPVEPPAPVERHSRRRPLRAVAVLGALVLAAAVAAVALTRMRDEPQPATRSAAPAQEPEKSAPVARPKPKPVPAARPKAKPTPTRTRTPPPTPTATVLGAKKLAPPSAPKPLPPSEGHRVYIWAPTDGALYYRVEFLRNGKPFHAAETAGPSLRLPATLRLPPGTYRWSVRPATVGAAGVVLQPAILTRTFEVCGG